MLNLQVRKVLQIKRLQDIFNTCEESYVEKQDNLFHKNVATKPT